MIKQTHRNLCRLWCLIILLSLIKYNDFFDQHDATLGTALSAPLSNRVQRHILNHFLEREIWPQSTEISKSYLFVHHEFEKWNWGHLKKTISNRNNYNKIFSKIYFKTRIINTNTAEKFSIRNLLSKCDQIRSFLLKSVLNLLDLQSDASSSKQCLKTPRAAFQKH